jgi:hypothetical protein
LTLIRSCTGSCLQGTGNSAEGEAPSNVAGKTRGEDDPLLCAHTCCRMRGILCMRIDASMPPRLGRTCMDCCRLLVHSRHIMRAGVSPDSTPRRSPFSTCNRTQTASNGSTIGRPQRVSRVGNNLEHVLSWPCLCHSLAGSSEATTQTIKSSW